MIGTTYSVIQPDIYQTFKDGDDFEHIIDNYIIETHSDDPQKREYLLSLPKREKRLKALSLRTKDLYEWKTLIDKITGSRVSNVDHLKQIISDFREFIKRAKVEDKLFGEVMTPLDELARPMVDLVEKYDVDFWKTPKKVLDSSAGIGTFLVICAAKFMNGLKNYPGLEDPEVRFKFIVENCLYYGELQSGNVSLWLSVIDPYDEYKTNTFWGSFLSDKDGKYNSDLNGIFDKHMKEVWNIDKFDLVIQNPPYSYLKETDKNKSSKNPKTQPMWQFFVQKSLKLLKQGGYMVMVHPGGWRDLDGVFKETQNILKEKSILELHMFPFKSGLEVFGAKTNFDYYILKNEENKGCITEIHCENGTIEKLNLLDLDYIPGENIIYINSLFAEENDEKIKLVSNSTYHTQQGQKSGFISKIKTDNHILPVVYMVSYKDIPTFTYSNKERFPGEYRGHFGFSKVIWAQGSSGVIVDKSGEFGMSEFSAAIFDDPENLDNIKSAIQSDKFIREVMLFKNGLGNKYNNKVISMLKKDFWREFI